MRFSAPDAGPAWREMDDLARQCEAAELTACQADAARLGSLGCTYGQIAAYLVQEHGVAVDGAYTVARRVARKAALRLERSRPAWRAIRRRQLHDLLFCARNRRVSDEALVEQREEMACERLDRLTAARPHGTVADDLLPDAYRAPLDFLRTFSRVLTVLNEGGQEVSRAAR